MILLRLPYLRPMHGEAATRADRRLKADGLEPGEQIMVLAREIAVLAQQRPHTLPLGHQIRCQSSHGSDYLPHVSHVQQAWHRGIAPPTRSASPFSGCAHDSDFRG